MAAAGGSTAQPYLAATTVGQNSESRKSSLKVTATLGRSTQHAATTARISAAMISHLVGIYGLVDMPEWRKRKPALKLVQRLARASVRVEVE